MAEVSLLNKVKGAMNISTTATGSAMTQIDNNITDLIEAAKLDLGIAGVKKITDDDALIIRAVITYCKMNSGNTGDYGDWNLLKKSYDEQKAQLKTSSTYNVPPNEGGPNET